MNGGGRFQGSGFRRLDEARELIGFALADVVRNAGSHDQDLEGGHAAHLTVNASAFPYIPQWIVIFTLLLLFSVDLYQNWWEQKFRKKAKAPIQLKRRKK